MAKNYTGVNGSQWVEWGEGRVKRSKMVVGVREDLSRWICRDGCHDK